MKPRWSLAPRCWATNSTSVNFQGSHASLICHIQTRKPKSVFISADGHNQEFQVLNICEFNSTRKRMSAVVRGPDGRIVLYTKGADSVIYERLAPGQTFAEPTLTHLEVRAFLDGEISLMTAGLCYRRSTDALPGVPRHF